MSQIQQNKINEIVSNNFKKILNSKKITIKELAEKSKIAKNTLTYIKYGRRSVSVYILYIIAETLNIDIKEFFQ